MNAKQRRAYRELKKIEAKPGRKSYAELKRYTNLLQVAIYPPDTVERIIDMDGGPR